MELFVHIVSKNGVPVDSKKLGEIAEIEDIPYPPILPSFDASSTPMDIIVAIFGALMLSKMRETQLCRRLTSLSGSEK